MSEPGIYMSSRRTICDGEVVTFATGFVKRDSFLGGWDPLGPFDVSASRNAVVVHRAECRTAGESSALIKAIRCAEAARVRLEPTWRGGAESKYPAEPTAVEPVGVIQSTEGVRRLAP